MTKAPSPPWMPPPEGFKAEDLDRIPDLPPHTELIDGSLVFVSPQAVCHSETIEALTAALRDLAPSELKVFREITMTLAKRQRPEPDISVVGRAAARGRRRTDLPAGDAVLVVEVVSPESEIRDRERKPQLYAAAGIPHFWLVEDGDDHIEVHVFELESSGAYALRGVHRDRLQLDRPFPIDIDLKAVADYDP